jgi:hypothetical protein
MKSKKKGSKEKKRTKRRRREKKRPQYLCICPGVRFIACLGLADTYMCVAA